MKRSSTALRSNVENEAVGAVHRGKAGLKTTRTVLGNIGNKPTTTNNGRQIKALKPSRVAAAKPKVAKIQKTSSRPVTRSSTEKTEEKNEVVVEQVDPPMDVDVEMEQVVVAFSTNNLENVDDIDKDDAENPQLVVEYVNETYVYLRQLEKEQSVREDYLNKAKTGTAILPKMRAVLVDWLIQVHQQFNLLQETLYLTVTILDRFLQDAGTKVERKQLQLVGVSAMFIASKYEEMYAPEIGDFVYITDRAYSEAQIRAMEIKILTVLRFELGRPLPLHFLRRNSKAGNVDALIHTLAKYIMELTLVEYTMAHLQPSVIAAAALALSLKVFDQEDKSIRDLWTSTLNYYTSYSFDTIADTVQKLANLLLTTSKADLEKAKLMAIRKKYEDKKLCKISCLSELTGQAVENLAQGDFS